MLKIQKKIKTKSETVENGKPQLTSFAQKVGTKFHENRSTEKYKMKTQTKPKLTQQTRKTTYIN